MVEFKLSIVPDGPTGMVVMWCEVIDHDTAEVSSIMSGLSFQMSRWSLPSFVEALLSTWARHGVVSARAWVNAVQRRPLTGRQEPLFS